MLPPLVHTTLAIPRASLENSIASLETRVLALVPGCNPLLDPSHLSPTSVHILISPTMNADHPLSMQNMTRHLEELRIRVVLSPRPMPKPAKSQSITDLGPVVVGLAAENGIRITNSAGVLSASELTDGNGVAIIFPLDTLPTISQSRVMPMANDLSVCRMTATGELAFRAYDLNGESHQPQRSLSSSTEDLVVSGLRMPSSASMRWPGSRVTKTPEPLSAYCEISWKKTRGHQPTSPMQVLAHEFLRQPEMGWLREVKRPLEFDKWVSRYPAVRQQQLRDGQEKANRYGLLPTKSASVQVFVKIETTTNATDPRNISPREDDFMAVLGPYVAAVERKAHQAPFLVKGMDLGKRDRKMGRLLSKKRFIEIDYSRFDMTINRSMLEVERTIVTAPFPRHLHPELHRCYDLMMSTKGSSQLGTLYSRLGGRNSGDLTTSIGNGLLNRFAVWYCLRKLPERSWVSFHEGDDGIIGVDEDVLDQAIANLQFLWTVGFQPKMDIYNDINQTSFCGRFLASTPDGLTTYCDPLRTMSKIHTTCASGDAKELMCAKTLSYAYTDGSTPVVGPYAYVVSELLREQLTRNRIEKTLNRLLKTNDLPWFYAEAARLHGFTQVLSARPRPKVNHELRAAFALRTGITIAEQINLESRFWGWLEQGMILDDIEPIHVPFTYKPNVWYDLNP